MLCLEWGILCCKAILHCNAMAVVRWSAADVHPADTRQMHTSNVIVQSPALIELQLVTLRIELLWATASIFDGVSGASINTNPFIKEYLLVSFW